MSNFENTEGKFLYKKMNGNVWINLNAYFVQASGFYSYFVRGAYCVHGKQAGVLATHYATGTTAVFYGSRVVVCDYFPIRFFRKVNKK